MVYSIENNKMRQNKHKNLYKKIKTKKSFSFLFSVQNLYLQIKFLTTQKNNELSCEFIFMKKKIEKQPYVILTIKIIHILDTLQIDGIVLKRKQIHTRCPVND